MIKGEYFLVAPVDMTLSEMIGIIAEGSMDPDCQFPVHWTSGLNASRSLDRAKVMLDNLLKNGNKYRIVKYTSTIEEIA